MSLLIASREYVTTRREKAHIQSPHMLLNALDYGSPESRLRYYFIGIRRDHMLTSSLEIKIPPHSGASVIDDFLDIPDGTDNPEYMPK